ncbi:ABC transporter ATP-binding protein [bacterium]|nr:ABC transporter ATP-binding protein [bacterium]
MIEIKNLTKKFGNREAISNLNINIKKGELYGFLGPNGAGKTTTIKILAGLIFPTSGSVRIGEYDLLKDSEKIKRITGYIPDRPFLYEKLTGKEFLKFVSELYDVPKETIDAKSKELLTTFDLYEKRDQLIETYSYGMRQKVVIASALIHDPEIIIVDEPIIGLDPKSIRLIKDIFRSLCDKKGVTIFMSTHTLSIAEELCNRVGIINNGKLITELTQRELKKELPLPSSNLEEIFLTMTSEKDLGSSKEVI